MTNYGYVLLAITGADEEVSEKEMEYFWLNSFILCFDK